MTWDLTSAFDPQIPRSVLLNMSYICAIKGDLKKTYTDLDPLEIDLMVCQSYDPATSDQVETFRGILWGINVLQSVPISSFGRFPTNLAPLTVAAIRSL